MYSDDSWSSDLEGTRKINAIINSFTRCGFRSKWCLNFTEKNPENTDAYAWFMSEDMKIKDKNIFFGHWSTLGDFCHENISCLDAGCVWGGEMIAIDLDEPQKKIKYKSSISR